MSTKYDYDNDLHDDGIQHGIDDNPNHDAQKGAVIGGIGGAAVGAAAGATAGTVLGLPGAVIGGLIGGAIGAAASGAAVAAIDEIDDDDTMTGLHEDGTNIEHNVDYTDPTQVNYNRPAVTDYDYGTATGNRDLTGATTGTAADPTWGTTPTTFVDPVTGADIPVAPATGNWNDTSPDTRGMSEKADAAATDDYDDWTQRRVA